MLTAGFESRTIILLFLEAKTLAGRQSFNTVQCSPAQAVVFTQQMGQKLIKHGHCVLPVSAIFCGKLIL